MPRIEETVRLTNKMGLHARPSNQIAETASRFGAAVQLGKDGMSVDAKSVIELLILAAECGSELVVSADGDDAEEAVAAIREVIDSRFGELDVDEG